MLVMTMTGGGTDASRESVDARTRDPAPQAWVRRHGPGDCPIAGDCAQHGSGDPRSPAAAELHWPLPASLSERVLEAMLYAGPGTQRGLRRKAEPDWTHVHHELRRSGVTLMLLWEEYRQTAPDGYGYSRWCELYRGWEGRLSPTMWQAHPAGERLFVAGQTVELVDGRTGKIRQAQVFVAVMGASSYTYAEASWTQTLPDWIGSHARALAFIGGVPAQLVPDNPKVGITRAN